MSFLPWEQLRYLVLVGHHTLELPLLEPFKPQNQDEFIDEPSKAFNRGHRPDMVDESIHVHSGKHLHFVELYSL